MQQFEMQRTKRNEVNLHDAVVLYQFQQYVYVFVQPEHYAQEYVEEL